MRLKILILFSLTFLSNFCFGQVPVLDSDPSITNKVVYLDFDGQVVSGTNWDSGNTINALASTMSTANIVVIFKRICEDFSPFGVSITTDPAKFNNAPANSRMRVIITPTSAWYGSAGGVAYVNSFTWGGTPGTPCWVFENQLSYSAKNIAEAASHEIGHTLTLRHQSTYTYSAPTCSKTAEYNPGQGTGVISWAPIMGVGYSKNVTVWYNGKSSLNCNLTQYDHSNSGTGITSPGYLSFRTDDVGNTAATGKIINLNSINLQDSGRITEPSDVDVYKFTICNNRYVSIDVKPWALDTTGYQGANLDIRLFLYNSLNNQLAVDSPLTKLNARIGMNLTPGTYHFVIDGGGSPNYSDYGSIGRYYIKVKATNPPLLSNAIISTGNVCSGQNVSLTYSSNGAPTQWLWTVGGPTSATYTSQNPTITFNPGIHTINLLATNSNSASCTVTSSLNVAPSPIVGVSGSDSPICTGSSATLSVTGASSYTWLPGAFTGISQIVTPLVNTTYSIIGVTGACSNMAITTLTVSMPFTISISASSTSICPGETVTLNASGATNYTFNPGGFVGSGITASPNATTNYTITGTLVNNGCVDDTTITISLKECDALGIRSVENYFESINIYPNPSHGYFIVETPSNDKTIEVFNATGQLITTEKMTGKPSRILTETWESGIYFVKLSVNGNVSHIEKIFVD